MSDTTITITPEERARMRQCVYLLPEPGPEVALRLLDALEAAEASKAEAEDYAEKLVYAVTDGNLSNSYDVQVVSDEVSRIWQSYTDQKVAAARAEADAENARLRAALTPSAETKAAYVDEVKMAVDTAYHEDSCTVRQDVTIPWVAIKEIMALIRKQAGQKEVK